MDCATARSLDSQPSATRINPLPSPAELRQRLPFDPISAARIAHQRSLIDAILAGADDRLLVIAGPCSLHDRDAALEYGRRLTALADELSEHAVIVMRAYVEKPRTTVGWKGLLHDPDLDGGNDIERGLHTTRALLIELAELGLPLATELLSPIAADYLADTLAWAAVGARTTESQTHRERVSALDLPVGFKNAPDGGLTSAMNAVEAASMPQHYIGVDDEGRPAAMATAGNPRPHLILRGGRGGPNYAREHVSAAVDALGEINQPQRLIVDCSHANSGKVAAAQPAVLADLAARRRAGERAIAGVMLESNLTAGKQKVGTDMTYGMSITDDCLGWDATANAIRNAVGA
ncbi:3-deoxy-7-phosphoheptulonate synthase [Salinisphaera sp. USBA-960]|nr:3-deoxy-7-phosphoheptulonate synthase [Salifodinibacter halophilus]NNC27016.1 3-deoxy-7-phosphoheptulonate synthase [Salifodinibacter halophilus]